MAVYMVGETAPYTAFNGHTMVAPIYLSTREGAEPFKISAEAWCVDSCRACRAGGRLEDFCGEVWDTGDGDDWAW